MFTNSNSRQLLFCKDYLSLNISYKPVAAIHNIYDNVDKSITHYEFRFALLFDYNISDDINERISWYCIYFNRQVSYDLYEACELIYKDIKKFFENMSNGDKMYWFNGSHKIKLVGLENYISKYIFFNRNKMTLCQCVLYLND